MPKKSLVLTEAEITEVLAGLGPDATHGNGLRAVSHAAALKIADWIEAKVKEVEEVASYDLFYAGGVHALSVLAEQLRQEVEK